MRRGYDICSTLHIMGGLVGAIVVEPSERDHVPDSITSNENHVLVITELVFLQETSDGEVSQGCGDGWACDPISQGPLCTGNANTKTHCTVSYINQLCSILVMSVYVMVVVYDV